MPSLKERVCTVGWVTVNVTTLTSLSCVTVLKSSEHAAKKSAALIMARERIFFIFFN